MLASHQYADLGHVYVEHHGWLLGWLSKKLGCSHQAADLAQDTFVRLLLKKVETYPTSTPRAYLVHIAKGLVIDHWRRQALERDYLEALAVNSNQTTAPSAELQAVVIETLLEIDAMLNQLTPKVRQAFLLAQIDGLSYKQIGVEIGVSERMIKKYMATAMMHCLLFKRQLEQH